MISNETLFIETVDSTNLLMKRLLAENPDLPSCFVVAADYQTAGRGQGANRWQSDAGQNILASILFHPRFSPSQQFVFNQCFSLAVRRMLLHYLSDVKIKWPNDIYVNHCKIAGILIEHSLEGERIKHTVAGIGLNVNQTAFDDDIPHPVSLKLLLGKELNPKLLLHELIEECKNINCINNSDHQKINKEYHDSLYLFEMYALYEIEEKTILAEIVGTDKFGRLLLKDQRGKEYCCGMKEVRFLSL